MASEHRPASEKLDMAEQLELERALEESRRSYEEEEVRRRRNTPKVRHTTSMSPEPRSTSVVLRRHVPRPVTGRPGSLGRLNPPPSSASSRRQAGVDLMKFEDDNVSSNSNSRDSGDWKANGSSFYDELESILNGSGDQNRASGSSYASSEDSAGFQAIPSFPVSTMASPSALPNYGPPVFPPAPPVPWQMPPPPPGTFATFDSPPRLPPRQPVMNQPTPFFVPPVRPAMPKQQPVLPICDSSVEVLKLLGKKPNEDLIDLTIFDPPRGACGGPSKRRGRASILAVFDPLNSSNDEDDEEDETESCETVGDDSRLKGGADVPPEDDWTYFESYDPFQFMYEQSSRSSERSDIYGSASAYCAIGINRQDDANSTDGGTFSPPPPPPRPPSTSADPIYEEVDKLSLKESERTASSLKPGKLAISTLRELTCLGEMAQFSNAVLRLRSVHASSNLSTNSGLIMSPVIDFTSTETAALSVKILVYSLAKPSQPVAFTSDLTATVDHVVAQAVCELADAQGLKGDPSDFIFKVRGKGEYVDRTRQLFEIEYVHRCIKFDTDVEFQLIPTTRVRRPFVRTSVDDVRDGEMSAGDLIPTGYGDGISHAAISVLFEVLNAEIEKMEKAAAVCVSGTELKPNPCVQATKALCSLLLEVETPEITKAVKCLTSAAVQGRNSTASPLALVTTGIRELETAFRSLLAMYFRCHRVDFDLIEAGSLRSSREMARRVKPKDLRNQIDTLLTRVCSVHRMDPSWSNYMDFYVVLHLFHGTRKIAPLAKTSARVVETSFYERIVFDEWVSMDSIAICTLPRESRLVFSLVAVPKADGNESATGGNNGSQQQQQLEMHQTPVELAWAGLQMFDEEGRLAQGQHLLTMWPMDADPLLGPAPSFYAVPSGQGCAPPLMIIELPDLGGDVMFPPPLELVESLKREFSYLDENTQQLLVDIVDSDVYAAIPAEDREILWEKRHYLHNYPRALPKILLAARSWEWSCLADLHAMVREWSPMKPEEALVLLLPCFPDLFVRRKAVEWLSAMGTDELIEYLPQLIQAVKHETYLRSDLVLFLLERALRSPSFAHRMHWLLDGSVDDTLRKRFAPTLKMVSRALNGIVGQALRDQFVSQRTLVRFLNESATQVKEARENLRKATLDREMTSVHRSLVERPTALPLSLSHIANGIDVRSCSYFTSNTLPLKVAFHTVDSEDTGGFINAIYKVGDDLRQDILTMQMVRIMDRLWVKEGLDLKLVHFDCVATGHKAGFVEVVTEADTLRKIQAELGLTGAFKDRPIAEWLKKHNPSKFDYERAVENFTASCAGYCVATYVLGICDRHNDNIMLKTTGHMFHIDFGKFLGDAEMFVNIVKRDRSPFVLTPDMVYVINGGEKPSYKFQRFVDLCCDAFNVLRDNSDLFLNLFALMTNAGIPGVTGAAVKYVQRALLPGMSHAEAMATFTQMIRSAMNCWFTQANFFFHSLGQLRFANDVNGDDDGGAGGGCDGGLLSFVPKRYSLGDDGEDRITGASIFRYQKRYTGEKHYVYIVRVRRSNQNQPSYLFRSYKEFLELHQKLCRRFPLAKFSSLPTCVTIGRSNVQDVAERRKFYLDRFLDGLFKLQEEIAHCDLVYTFFHPLLRDQEEADIYAAKLKDDRARRTRSLGTSGVVQGKLRLSFVYKKDTFQIMVHHAQDLAPVNNDQDPSVYVKIYLLPDPHKHTKRKTRVADKSRHPTFMEPIEYRVPIHTIKARTLQAAVYHYDKLQENQFLGKVTIKLADCDLSQETVQWYALQGKGSK